MVITTTSAAALAAGSALREYPRDQRPAAITLLTLVAGAVLLAAGIARHGRYTRLVSYSVMTGFLTGIAINIIASQIPDLTGRSQRPLPAGEAREHLLSLLPGILHSQDAAEGLRSFTERREGRFTGH